MKKEGYRRKTTCEKKKKTSGLARVCPSRPGHGLTRRVDWVWPGRSTGRSFGKPGPVQPPSFGSTCRAYPGLITMVLDLVS